jgi:adenylosuccinate synthase
MGAVTVVVGGQFGSEGKGAVAAHIARRNKVDVCVRVAGPNAGHTAVDDHGKAWALRQVPCVAVVDKRCTLIIGAGSEIDPDVLLTEIKELDAAGFAVSSRLWIDRSATLITPEHKVQEGAVNLVTRIGSTGKGVGAARADRVMRVASTVADEGFGADDRVIDTTEWLAQALLDGSHVMIEGTQGYGLGIHTPYYPQTTSSDCRAIDFLAMAGVSPWQPGAGVVNVWIVCRTFPIRVAGNSGPLKDELTWAEVSQLVGRELEERTTVTQKVRRVGKWDPDLVKAAVRANGGGRSSGDRVGFRVKVALTFADYWWPELFGHNDGEGVPDQVREQVRLLEREIRAPIALVTTGPDTGWWRG